MIEDNVYFKGHFNIEVIKDGVVIDSYEEDNLIMSSARQSMSEIFARLGTSKSVNKFVLGSSGHKGTDILSPKQSEDGFVKERDRLFSEFVTYNSGDTILKLLKGDLIKYGLNYYRYDGSYDENFLINDSILTNTSFVSVTKPETFSINFEMSTVNGTPTVGSPATILSTGLGSTVSISQTGSSVIFFINISINDANPLVSSNSNIFTEAALYANGRIFSMKTFKGKIKDNTCALRIIWTITFYEVNYVQWFRRFLE